MDSNGIALAAAEKLGDSYGEEIVAEVQLALASDRRRETLAVDPISLGGLIVSVATLAWTIYKDTRTKAATELSTAVSLKLDAGAIAPEDRKRIVDAVVATILEQG